MRVGEGIGAGIGIGSGIGVGEEQASVLVFCSRDQVISVLLA